jgi:hypothetical protein
MREITRKAYNTFNNKKHFTLANTKVRIFNGSPHLYLHDNLIVKEVDGDIYISNGGWNSNTTRERLNPFVKKIRKQGDNLIINEKLNWDGEWLNISKYNDKR